MTATGFPRYKSCHGRGADFNHHRLGAATLATECVAVNQTSPLELVQMSLATIPADAMLYKLARSPALRAARTVASGLGLFIPGSTLFTWVGTVYLDPVL
jgi:hypothetical protein